ncbi:hypothetical protein [Aliikangiella coralliicola]|uniref:Uncharacterized protein n=1 Tax=Aliikangiella coralliicola TaxID=2592383 RepID=A0A545U7I0_9GAMM|nr:hypothetical protein [Aliikangiella coralliicola]TQV85426.1 hypothetical protein FLL46_19875 [Aliikangiella coralliicola]
MNVALPALLVFFFIIPGFIFQKFFRKGIFEVEYKEPFASSTLITVISAIVLNSFFVFLIWLLAKINAPIIKAVDQKLLVEMFVSSKNIASKPDTVSAISSSIPYVVGYILFSCFGGAFFGLLCRVVLEKNLKRQTVLDFFLGSNEWEKIFWVNGKKSDNDLTRVAATIDLAGGTYIYTGFLKSFSLDKSGDLDRLELIIVSRRKLDNDLLPENEDPEDPNDPQDRFYEIIGDRFVCKYQDIKTLNIEYLEIEESESQEPETAKLEVVNEAVPS